MMIPLLAEIDEAIAAVEEKDIRRAMRGLTHPAKNEVLLGQVHAIETRRVWALYTILQGKAAEQSNKARFEAETVDEEIQFRAQSERWADMAHAVGVLFWLQAKDDVGEAAWIADARGKRLEVRADYQIVAFDRPQNPLAALMGTAPGEQPQ